MRWSRGEVHGAAAASSAAQPPRPVTRGATSGVVPGGLVVLGAGGAGFARAPTLGRPLRRE